MKPISDPALLEQLEAAPIEPVSDPELLRQLEGLAPVNLDEQRRPLGGALGILPFAEDSEGGVHLSVPGMILEPWRAFNRGLARESLRGMRNEDGTPIDIDAAQSADAQMAAGIMNPGSRTLTTAPAVVAPKTARQTAIDAANRLEVPVPRGAAGSRAEQIVSGALAETPVVGSPLQKASATAIDKLDDTRAGIVDELGSGSVKAAGDAVKDDTIKWVKTVSKDEAAKIFEPVDKLVGDAKGPLSRTAVAAKSLIKDATESGLPPPAIVAQLKKALEMPDGLSYRAMQRLRTEIGDRISGDIVPEPGMSKRALKAIYAGLSDDLEFLVGKAGGKEGKAAWKTANEAFQTEIAKRRDDLTKIVGTDGNASAEAVAERLFTMAGAKGGADLDNLLQARKTVGEATWKELGSALIGRLGNTKNGFSAAQYRTDWHKLSDAGKDALFTPEHRAVLDDIAVVAGEFENLQKLGNPSGSGRMATITGAAALAVHNPLLLMQSAVGGYVLARVLAQPVTAKATGGWMRSYVKWIKDGTTESYEALKRAGLDLRTAMDRFGMPAAARLAVAGSQTEGDEVNE